MKKIFSLTLLILLIITIAGFSQDKPEKMRPALVVIDIQNAFLPRMDKADVEPAMENINAYIDLFRKNGFPVIRIYHSDIKYEYGPKEGTEEFEFPKSVQIKPEDPKVIKHYGDGFNKTELDKILKDKKVNTIFLCGLSATGCVLATYIGAENYDYNAFFLKGAIISPKAAYTKNIEDIFEAVGYGVVKVMLNGAEK